MPKTIYANPARWRHCRQRRFGAQPLDPATTAAVLPYLQLGYEPRHVAALFALSSERVSAVAEQYGLSSPPQLVVEELPALRTPVLDPTDALIAEVARQIMRDDLSYTAVLRKPTRITPTCVGGAAVRTADGRRRLLPIDLDDAYFGHSHAQQNLHAPLAALIRTTDGGDLILINHVAYEWAGDPKTEELIVGMLAHELGHDLAGHLGAEKAPPRLHNLDPDGYAALCAAAEAGEERALRLVFWVLAEALLRQGVYRSEVEADRHAMALVGVAPVLAMQAHNAATSLTIGSRLELENRLRWHAAHLHEPDYLPAATRELEFGFTIYTEAERARIRAGEALLDEAQEVEATTTDIGVLVPLPLTAVPEGGWRGEFTDIDGEACVIRTDALVDVPLLQLGATDGRMRLTQDHIGQLLPHLIDFYATGALRAPPAQG